MSKVTTARINLNPTEGQETVAIQMLGDPGERKAYKLLSFGLSGAMTGAGGSDGVIVALQDGRIDEVLLDPDEAGQATRFVNTDGIFDDQLSVSWSLAISATGSGLGWSSAQKVWVPGWMTANPQIALINMLATGFKRLMVHLEYEQVSVSAREWTELKHRSTVVDLLWDIAT